MNTRLMVQVINILAVHGNSAEVCKLFALLDKKSRGFVSIPAKKMIHESRQVSGKNNL
jgi:hypothetical protein